MGISDYQQIIGGLVYGLAATGTLILLVAFFRNYFRILDRPEEVMAAYKLLKRDETYLGRFIQAQAHLCFASSVAFVGILISVTNEEIYAYLLIPFSLVYLLAFVVFWFIPTPPEYRAPPFAETENPPPPPAPQEVQEDLRPFDAIDAMLSRLPKPPPYHSSVRFSHQWIVGGSGHGKTNLIEYQLHHDLVKVQKGKASVIVIDSQGDLIRKISELRVFAPNHPLFDRLVHIDPTDIDYPVSLNMFDINTERMAHYSALDRERLTNSIIELYDFVLGSLMDAEMTSKQSTVFRFITRLMLHIPDATIHTLRELLEPQGYEKYKQYIEKLEGTPRAFFETEFRGKEFVKTKQEVLRRLYGVLENRTFERMFSNPRSKLDIFKEMNAGKVILVNTAKDLLKQNGTQLFGRFFIALIAQAAQERATIQHRLPTYVYIDEAHEYMDRNVATILEQARKYNVGLVISHQYLGQLEQPLLNALSANTAIKIAGGVSQQDVKFLAPAMHANEYDFRGGRGSFVTYIRGILPHGTRLDVPESGLAALPQMIASDRLAVRQRQRQLYAAPTSTPPPSSARNLDDVEM